MKLINETLKLFVILIGPIIAIPSVVMCSEFNIIKFGKYLIFGDEFENIGDKLDSLENEVNDIGNKVDGNNNNILTVENAVYVSCGLLSVGIIIFIVYFSFNGGVDGSSIKSGFESIKDEVGKTSSNIILDNHKILEEVVNLTKSVNENITLTDQRSNEILKMNATILNGIQENMSQIMAILEKNEKLISERVLPKLVSLLGSKVINNAITKDSAAVNQVNIVPSENNITPVISMPSNIIRDFNFI